MQMKYGTSLKELKSEIDSIKKRHPGLKDDSAFVFWFISAYLIEDREEAAAKSALTGKQGGHGGEKNIDAIYINEKNNQCNIIQGKFHISDGVKEKRNDVLSFADLALKPWESQSALDVFYSKLDPIVAEKFSRLVDLVKNKKYRLNLYYVTTGTCSQTIIDEAEYKVGQAQGLTNIAVLTQKDVLRTLRDYLDDITPHIQPLKLKIISEGAIQNEGSIHRFDPNTKIESWVVSARGSDIAAMYNEVGRKLFAKNIRGYLGNTNINESISSTIRGEPDNFWYYNNGITIVCDFARKQEEGGEDFITLEGAQIINGQQTTITLNKNQKNLKNTNILVKIIKVPREELDIDYDRLINSIVKAANWQNYISPSDLVSNDSIQVFLQKEFRQVRYQYIRKKTTKIEARKDIGQCDWQIGKLELAQAVGSCIFDPIVVRRGKEGLFEDPYYKSVFGSKSISFYLSKYWLMKEVQNAARGHPERAYAKWLVQNFIWREIGKDINTGSAEKKFRYSCERRIENVKTPLNNALVNIFRGAIKYYRLNRGKGEAAKDISKFFYQDKLHNKFAEFWESIDNPYKKRVVVALNKFRQDLQQLDINE